MTRLMRMARIARGWILSAGLGALAVFLLWSPAPEIRYNTVTVTDTLIVEQEPRVELRWRDRIVTVTVEPEIVASSPIGGEINVNEFCRASVETALAGVRPDTVVIEDSRPPVALLLRSGSLDEGWFGRSDELILTGPTSDGGLQQQSYRVRGSHSFIVDGDSVLVRQGRFGWLKDVAEIAVPALVGYGIGRW